MIDDIEDIVTGEETAIVTRIEHSDVQPKRFRKVPPPLSHHPSLNLSTRRARLLPFPTRLSSRFATHLAIPSTQDNTTRCTGI